MAAVMGHGGDGGDEPPYPFGGGFGDHQNDGDVEAARAQAHTGMDRQCWNVAIDCFLTEKHQKRSAGNKECRKKQVVKNRGGTCSYGSACFKKTHHIADSDPDTIDWIIIFEKMLGTQRGHVRGIGPKPSSAAGTSVPSQWQSQSQAPQPTQTELGALFEEPLAKDPNL
ncbi:unnamed protein product [Lactuca virosa]|uniref:Uncharacterized protein n=1 Tax=Lactuca virosa TaxID=75947 RepID=A0AAU9PQZ6_9ASTR|nr:unnamed protein product [Lactuca virosa]